MPPWAERPASFKNDRRDENLFQVWTNGPEAVRILLHHRPQLSSFSALRSRLLACHRFRVPRCIRQFGDHEFGQARDLCRARVVSVTTHSPPCGRRYSTTIGSGFFLQNMMLRQIQGVQRSPAGRVRRRSACGPSSFREHASQRTSGAPHRRTSGMGIRSAQEEARLQRARRGHRPRRQDRRPPCLYQFNAVVTQPSARAELDQVGRYIPQRGPEAAEPKPPDTRMAPRHLR